MHDVAMYPLLSNQMLLASAAATLLLLSVLLTAGEVEFSAIFNFMRLFYRKTYRKTDRLFQN